MDELTLYLGTLAAIGIGALVLIVIVLTRGSGGGGRASQQRLRAEQRAVAVSRVQVVLEEPDAGLIWVVNGRATRELAAITDPAERRAIERLLERVRDVEIPLAPSEAWGELPPLETAPSPVEQSHTDNRSLPPSRTEEFPPERGTAEDETPDTGESSNTPPSASAYEDELTRPFLARLRDSLFGIDYDAKPAAASSSWRPPPAPLKKGKSKESADDSGYGLPRFEELNSLLQERLLGMPDAPPTTIRTGRNGMVEILVDGRVYDHIDDVPVDSVRQAMREAVAIWNSR